MKNFNRSQCGCVLKNFMNNLGQNAKHIISDARKKSVCTKDTPLTLYLKNYKKCL